MPDSAAATITKVLARASVVAFAYLPILASNRRDMER